MEGYEVTTLDDVVDDRRHLRHRHRQQGHHHGRAHGPDEAQRDRRQHRPLRQRDRHGRPGPHERRPAGQHQAAGRRVRLPRRPLGHRAGRGPAAEPRLRHRPPELRDVDELHQPGARPDRAVHRTPRRTSSAVYVLPEAARREGRPPAPRRPRRASSPSSPTSRPTTSASRSRAPSSPTTTATEVPLGGRWRGAAAGPRFPR